MQDVYNKEPELWGGIVYENYELFAQFFCKLKTILKNKAYYLKKKKRNNTG